MLTKYYVKLAAAVLLLGFSSNAAAQASETSKYPPLKYVSQLRNLNDYYLYANGGFHADWYIGYNNCWIIKLPPVKKDGFVKAFIGAKIGRAKTNSFPSSYDTAAIPGKIYMGISASPQFSSDSSYFLVSTEDLPKEALPSDSLEGVDSAKWFWAQVPLSKINDNVPNYLAVWSQDNDFVSSSSSPIVAAGYASSEDEPENVWLNRSVKGNPPSGENALETPISGIKPALALKLVPQNEFKVVIKNFSAEIDDEKVLLYFSVIGADIEKAWLEMSYDKFEWQNISGNLYEPPWFFTLKREDLPADMFYLRAVAQDSYENVGYSRELTVPRKSQPGKENK